MNNNLTCITEKMDVLLTEIITVRISVGLGQKLTASIFCGSMTLTCNQAYKK